MAGARFRARPGARSRETRDGGQIPEPARVRRRPAACGRRRDPHAAARGEAHHREHPLRQIQLETRTKGLRCGAVEVPENGLKECEADGGLKVVVAKAGGEFFGFQAICPHQEVPLCEGLFDGSVLTCHMHLWQWDVRTGAPLGIAEAPLQRYPVAIEGDSLYLGGDDSALGAGELFNGLEQSILEKLAALARRESYQAGAMLYRPGDPAEDFFVLESGRGEFLLGRSGCTGPGTFYPKKGGTSRRPA